MANSTAKGSRLKIVVCSKRDLAGCLALNKLVGSLSANHEVHVILSDYVLEEEKANPHAKCLATHERDVVVDYFLPYIDTSSEHEDHAAFLSFQGMAEHYDIPFSLLGPMRSVESIAAIKKLAPDLILSCRYDYIIPQEVIDLPRLGTYGLHPGALPRLQGLCSPFRAMEQESLQSGCTLFHLDRRLDTGPVADIGWWKIDYSRSLLWNFVHTYFAGIEVFLAHLPLLENGERLKAKPQTQQEQHYFSYPTEEEFQNFIHKGRRLVSTADYLELLSWFLPEGVKDRRFEDVKRLVSPVLC